MTKKHGPWTIKETRGVYRNEFIEVLEDEVTQPDGEPGTYAIVKMKPGISILPVDDDGTVYLTKQFRYAIGRESIEAVCGGLDEGEDELEGARRELREELGIEAGEWQSLGPLDVDTSIVNAPARLFLARRLRFRERDQDATEAIKPFQTTLAEAVRMVMDSRITHAPTSALVLKAARFLKE